MSRQELKPTKEFIFRIFKDDNLEDTYEPEQIAKFIKPYLKPWMKTSVVEYKTKKFCQVTVTEEYDAAAALCDCLDEGFLIDSEELDEIDLARCAHGYYDFFFADQISDELQTNYLLIRAKYLLKGYTLHKAFINSIIESGIPVDYETLKNKKPRFVSWLVEHRKMSKEDAIALVNKDVPELIDASSEHPKIELVSWSDKPMDEERTETQKHLTLQMLEQIFGRNFLVSLGFKRPTEEDLDKLFNG